MLKKSVFCLIFVQLLSMNAYSDVSCPLSNPAYKTLRQAAEALEKKILLPTGCEDAANQLNASNALISNSLKDINTAAGGTNQNKAQVDNALSGINQVSQVFNRLGNDKCGKALVSTGDYVVAFTDTIMALTPLLMSFQTSGALPYVMGAQVLGASVKTFVSYINTLKVDMSTAQARQAFIENACGYYRLNENLRSFLQMLKGEQSDIEKLVIKLKTEVTELEANSPEKPQMDPTIIEIDTRYAKDQAYFEELSAIMSRSTSDALRCSLVKSQVQTENDFPNKMFINAEYLLKDSEIKGANITAKQNVLLAAIELNKSELFGSDVAACSKHASDWMQVMNELLQITNSELSLPGRRDLQLTVQGSLRKDWEKKLKTKKDDLAATQNRLSFLKALADKGMEIELSELLDIRDNVRRELFGDGKEPAVFWLTHKKRSAESWLAHKWRSARVQLKDYRKLMPFMRRNYLETNMTEFPTIKEKNFACAYAENAVLTENTAEKHIEATQLFCETFEQTINVATHPYASKYCLGRFNKKGEKKSEGKLDLTVADINSVKPEVQAIIDWMKKSKCSPPKTLETIIL